jgi:hypothetical protein
VHFWFSVYIHGVEIVDGPVFLDFPLVFHTDLQSDFLRESRVNPFQQQSVHWL